MYIYLKNNRTFINKTNKKTVLLNCNLYISSLFDREKLSIALSGRDGARATTPGNPKRTFWIHDWYRSTSVRFLHHRPSVAPKRRNDSLNQTQVLIQSHRRKRKKRRTTKRKTKMMTQMLFPRKRIRPKRRPTRQPRIVKRFCLAETPANIWRRRVTHWMLLNDIVRRARHQSGRFRQAPQSGWIAHQLAQSHRPHPQWRQCNQLLRR